MYDMGLRGAGFSFAFPLKRRSKMNKKGVTLLELIVVMVIIAIGSLALAPSIGTWITHFRLRGATRDIASILRTAQMKAVSRNLTYRVDFDLGANSIQLKTSADGSDAMSETLPRGVTLTDVSFSGGVTHVFFHADSTASAGHVKLKDTKGTEKTVNVSSSTGRVSID